MNLNMSEAPLVRNVVDEDNVPEDIVRRRAAAVTELCRQQEEDIGRRDVEEAVRYMPKKIARPRMSPPSL